MRNDHIKLKRWVILLFCWIGMAGVAGAQEVIDGVVAVVGDEIVLKSELEQMAQYYALQMGLRPLEQKTEYNRLIREILQNLIDERVLLAKAKEDTITVEDQKVDAELENYAQRMIQQLGSVEKVEAQFGAPIKKIKRDNREEVKKRLIVGKLQNKKFQGLQVSRRDVESFYESVKDSLPEKKPMVKLSQILLRIQPGEASRIEAREKIAAIQARLAQGESFPELAKQVSEDPGTAKRGGELGFVERGTLFPSFEEAVFKLEPGQVSDIVETPIGFHLIQALEKRGDKINCRHILIRVEKSSQDEELVLRNLEKIRSRILAGEDFKQVARSCSEDSTTRNQGGELGWLTPEDIQIDSFKNAVDTLRIGEITRPFQTQFGFHIVRMDDKKGIRKYNLDEDYEEFKSKALDMKMQKLRKQWIEDLKKTVYIEIKDDMI
jgi:peptidyl-prolyl cis-trans isomerase SurA